MTACLKRSHSPALCFWGNFKSLGVGDLILKPSFWCPSQEPVVFLYCFAVLQKVVLVSLTADFEGPTLQSRHVTLAVERTLQPFKSSSTSFAIAH